MTGEGLRSLRSRRGRQFLFTYPKESDDAFGHFDLPCSSLGTGTLQNLRFAHPTTGFAGGPPVHMVTGGHGFFQGTSPPTETYVISKIVSRIFAR